MELSTTTICSGILTSTEMRPSEKRVRAATQCPPGPSKENATRSSGESLLSWSLKEKLSGWSNLPAARILLKNWNDSVQMVLGNRHVKILQTEGRALLRMGWEPSPGSCASCRPLWWNHMQLPSPSNVSSHFSPWCPSSLTRAPSMTSNSVPPRHSL